jgi:hypothetical protein
VRRPALALVAVLLLGAAEAPAPLAPAAPAPADATLEQFLAQRGFQTVQLRENAFSQLEADVLVNGEHRLRVQISTSFSKTLFDEAAVKALGLAITPSNVELAGEKKQKLGTLQLDRLAVGDAVLGAATVFTADLASLVGTATTDPVQGVIGSDLLNKYQAVLDVPASKLYLRIR